MIADYQIQPNCCAAPGSTSLSSFIDTAVACRAGVVALILGSVLTLVNQTDALIGENHLQALPLAIAYVIPFLVALISQALGARQARRVVCQRKLAKFSRDTLLRAALSHGNPASALLLAMTIGAANALIVVGAATSGFGEYSAASVAQGFILPMLFGLLSQAVAYRCVTRGFTSQLNQKRNTP